MSWRGAWSSSADEPSLGTLGQRRSLVRDDLLGRRRDSLRSAAVAVREADEADLQRVAEIKVRNWADTYAPLVSPAVLEPFLDRAAQVAYLGEAMRRPATLFLVAEDATGTIVGFALTYLDEQPDPWLESLHVIRESRGSGAGTELMRATAAQLLARGHRTMRLGVVRGNTAAGRFYERLGGTMTGQEPASWGDGVWHDIYRWSDVSTLA